MAVTFDKLISKPLMHKHKASDISDSSTSFLKLDQTTPQTVTGGAPIFNEGIEITKDKYIILNQ